MAKGKKANLFVWIILGLLIIGLAGFGLENFGNTVRSIGSVGDRTISTGDYARALRQEIRAEETQRGRPVPISEVQALGIEGRVIGQLITIAALENEADRIRISVSDDTVAREILEIPAFRGTAGSFDRDLYRFAIQSQGYSEREFEARLRDELARTILQSAVIGGVEAPEAHVALLFDHIGQRRTIDVLTLTAEDLVTPLDTPDEATLRAHYEARLDAFTLPEIREISYVLVTPDMILDAVEVDEESLRALYAQRLNVYVRPERRLVERLVFSTEAAAQEAADRIASGAISFEDLVAERELTLEDIDLGDVAETALGAAGPAVFALDDTGIVGPLQSPLGPALFRVNAILNAQETPFEDAAEELREELAADRARRLIADERETLTDLLAGGLTLEEIADETIMELGRIDWSAGQTEGLAAYPEFREAAAVLAEDDFAELVELSDGGVFALRLDAVRPPAAAPFEEVREAVAEDWAMTEALRLLTARAEALIEAGALPQAPEARADLDLGAPADPGTGGAAEVDGAAEGTDEAASETGTPGLPGDLGFGEFALGEDAPAPSETGAETRYADRFEALGRSAFLPGLPRRLIEAAFRLEEGEIRIVPGEGAELHLVQLVEVLGPDPDAPQAAAIRGLVAQQTTQGIAQDLFAHFVSALERQAGVRLDDRAVSAVNANLR